MNRVYIYTTKPYFQVRDDEEDETIATRLTKGDFTAASKSERIAPTPKLTLSSAVKNPPTMTTTAAAESAERSANSLFLRPQSFRPEETLPSAKQSFKADGLVSSTPTARANEEEKEEEKGAKREDTQSHVLPRESGETERKSISQGHGVQNAFSGVFLHTLTDPRMI